MMNRAVDMLTVELGEGRLVVAKESSDEGFDDKDVGAEDAYRPLDIDDDTLVNCGPIAVAIEAVMDTMLNLLGTNSHEKRLMVAGTLLASVAVEATAPVDGGGDFRTSAYNLGEIDPNNVFDKSCILGVAALTVGIAKGIGDLMDNNEELEDDLDAEGRSLDDPDYDHRGGELIEDEDEDEDLRAFQAASADWDAKNELPPGGHDGLSIDEWIARGGSEEYEDDGNQVDDEMIWDHTPGKFFAPAGAPRGVLAPETGAEHTISMDDIPTK
jgi:hypothetical protein